MAKALVTGSHGFIATHLIQELYKRDITPIALPREILLDPFSLPSFITSKNPDYIFHTASYGNMHGQTDRQKLLFTNFALLAGLLEATEGINYKAFINFGSSSEYGIKDEPMIESMQCMPETFYGGTKLAGTTYAQIFAKQLNKPIVTVRPFSVYGEGEADFRFIPQVIKHIQDYSPMEVDLYAMHDWIYVEDLIKGVMTVVDNIDTLKGQVVNIGTGREYKNIELVNILEDIIGEVLQMNYPVNKMRKNDSPMWVDGSTILRDLGWKPTIGIEEGLSRCYDFYKNIRNNI